MEPQTCPWDGLREWSGPPNVDWCEESFCAWVKEPANTWSNLAFVFVAAVIFFLSRKESARTLRFFATAAFWVGVTSLAYHASITFATQVLDFFGMYFFFVLIVLLNLIRLGHLRSDRLFVALWPLIALLTAVTVAVAKANLPVQGIIGVLLLAALVLEVLATRRGERQPGSHRWFFGALAFIALGGAFSVSDVTRVFCDPQDHFIQGHAIWHLLTSMGILLSYLHYRQFRAVFI